MKLRLSVIHTAHPGSPPREFEFSVGPVAVGRSAIGQIVIEGPSISRVHVSFDTVHGAWHVTHEGSAAPTFLNGAQLPKGRPTRVADGDRVVVGSHEVVVALPEVGESIPGIEPLRDSFVAHLDAEEPVADALPPSVFAAPAAPAFPFPATSGPAPAAPAPAPARPGPAGRVVPTLVAVRGAPDSCRLELRDPTKNYVIGRAATCDLTLADTSISRQHAFARFDGSRVFVRDAQSRTPIRVNDRPIVGETPLTHGDVVSVGPVDLKFLCEADPIVAVEPEPEDDGRATFMPKDDRTQLVQRAAPEPLPPVAEVPWQPAAPEPAPAFPAAAAPVAPAPWDRAAQPAAPAPSWESAAAVPPPAAPRREPPPARREPPVAPAAPAPAPTPAQDWTAMSERAAAPPRQVAPPAWETPRAAPAPALPPSPVHWDVPSAPDIGGAPPWGGPPPVGMPSAANIDTPQVPDMFSIPSAPQMPVAPHIDVPPPPPAPAAPAPKAGGAGGAEPRVVTRRSSTHRGWLVAGVVCMLVAVVTGSVFILVLK